MACFHPLRAYRTPEGVITFDARAVSPVVRMHGAVGIPCGQCTGCRLELRRQKAMRMVHESKLHEHNCFVTLTYDDEHLPEGGTLVPRDMELFVKRLRYLVAPRRIRFAGCGEYGDSFGRPHYHMALFGHSFVDDRYVWAEYGAKGDVYRSPLLEKAWKLGMSSVSDLNYKSAAYIASYVHKKITGDLAESHYGGRHPEFWRASNRPGLGLGWVEKFAGTDVWPHDRVVFNGREVKPPRYYDQKLRELDPDRYREMLQDRVIGALERLDDQTPERLLVREAVAKAALKRR